ncbi:hypothetical protein Lepto7376_2441 [[Leptolyngbya] sp. PCC 7376]|uniref:hypothetical protein n=1 Tax=[Leptolyngbya] sp. PCC 7376 TaxID=111781 RepID=UPI00029F1EB5|nr:hypothetical protein [[Leptolyngbya] sp. PCC 7376]AFY38720.1 hypothetical protein Lepto7376_2441 [[Leptolyngbya] sp. PCC 7376]
MSFSASHSRKSGAIALFGTLFISSAIAPFISMNAAQAQLFKNQRPSTTQNRNQNNNRNRTVNIAAGAEIPVMVPEAEKILVAPDETMELTVEVAANLKDRYGEVLIPYGTKIEGRIEPVDGGGSQFVARELIFDEDDTQAIYGESRIITRTETIEKGADGGDILEGALIGAGAGLLVSILTGDPDVDFSTILLGGGLGALGGWALGGEEAEVVAIDPDRDLDIILSDRLTLQPYDYRTTQTARNDDLIWD